MIVFFIGIVLMIFGALCLYMGRLDKKFYERIRDDELPEYKKTIGVVICDAYHISDATEVVKAVTPIVEYEVNGKKYEAQNPVLETGAELPIGTKVYVWYKKDNPKISVLGTELGNNSFKKVLGFLLIAFGLMLVLLDI